MILSSTCIQGREGGNDMPISTAKYMTIFCNNGIIHILNHVKPISGY